MINKDLLEIVVCPATHQKLFLASGQEIEKINQLISEKKIKNVAGKTIEQKTEGILIREDRKVGYPVREGIPVLLIEEGLELK
ncbi:MAG TPA: Trm112 family protein [Oligoflexia bacterium]|nr:Trm112 family protein [Oligoflexia bacterium]HMP26818.1 Trm112 family protein [Oligoflexia bacterium]